MFCFYVLFCVYLLFCFHMNVLACLVCYLCMSSANFDLNTYFSFLLQYLFRGNICVKIYIGSCFLFMHIKIIYLGYFICGIFLFIYKVFIYYLYIYREREREREKEERDMQKRNMNLLQRFLRKFKYTVLETTSRSFHNGRRWKFMCLRQ